MSMTAYDSGCLRSIGFITVLCFYCIVGSTLSCQGSNPTANKIAADAGTTFFLNHKRKKENNAFLNKSIFAAKTVRSKHKDDLFLVPLGLSPRSGPDDAKVTAVLFGDLEQKTSEDVFNLLLKTREHDKSFRWVFKFYPQGGIGGPAMMVSLAASYASDLGKFAAFAQKVFALKGHFTKQALGDIASGLGMDKKSVLAAIADESRKKTVLADRRLAARLGVAKAPGLFVNGRLLNLDPHGNMQQVLSRAVDKEARRATLALENGISGSNLYRKLTEHGRRSAWLNKSNMMRTKRTISPGHGYYSRDSTERTFFVSHGPGPFLGVRNSPVCIIVFVSATCSFCGGVLTVLKRISSKYPQKVGVWVRHLPDSKRRPGPMAAAVLLQASSSSPKYWDLAPKIMSGKVRLEMDSLLDFAQKSGFEIEKLRKQLTQTDKWEKLLDENRVDADKLGIHSSPYLFVNGRPLMGSTGFHTLDKMVKEEIEGLSPTLVQ